MQKGIFIVIEGIDGTGKSSQVKRLGEWFTAQGRDVVLSREPTDGPWGTKLRRSMTAGRLSADEELECFIEDRKEHVANLIAPSLAAGKVVILDRYYFSNMAYQGARGFDPLEIRKRNETFAPQPDLLLILDLDVDTALTRINARGDGTNEFEKRENLQACRDIFLSLQNEPFTKVIPCDGSMDEVSEKIASAIHHFVRSSVS